jgi:SAM-dependent methyltransferase
MKLLLEKPSVYQVFSRIVGADRSRSIHVKEYVKPRVGDRVLDIGCGPADILDYLPKVDYIGFDINPSYIESARKRYGGRGQFHCQRVSEVASSAGYAESFDIVLATGILHHLDDREALELFDIARRALRPGGRLVTLDGCYAAGQSRIAAYLLSRDRGRFVRTPDAYAVLARQAFPAVTAAVRHDTLRIPYSHLILECVK